MMNTKNRNLLIDLFQAAGRGRTPNWESNVKFGQLQELMSRWWEDYKAFERDDTIATAYSEQRLTVKGMDSVWYDDIAFKGADKKMHTFHDPQGKAYPLDKGLKGLRLRLVPTNFMPYGGGDSQKVKHGLHDTSTGLMKSGKKISEQQYKTLLPGSDNVTKKIYCFMPLAYPEDQTVFHMVNELAKKVRVQRPQFHMLVRFYRARMTRIKLAAEHDMSTNFSLAASGGYKVNSAGETLPRFRFSLLATTDATRGDEPHMDDAGKRKLAKGGLPGQKIFTVPTTRDLLEARQQAALNYRQLILDKWRYGEVVCSYRQHAGGFPVFTMFSPDDQGFLVGTVDNDVWVAKDPKVVIPDMPA